MNRILTCGLSLALSALLAAPSFAERKDDDKKGRDKKAAPAAVQKSANRTVTTPVGRERREIAAARESQVRAVQRPAVSSRTVVRSPNVVRPPAVAQAPAVNRSRNLTTSRTVVRDVDRRTDWNRGERDSRGDWDRDGSRGWSGYRYYHAPSHIYSNWDRGRIYSWNNHRYHWYGGSWVLIDPGYAYVSSYDTVPYIGSNVVSEVQLELVRLGYDPGPVDGVMGGQTRSAIAEFQADRGLAVTGRIDNALLAALRI